MKLTTRIIPSALFFCLLIPYAAKAEVSVGELTYERSAQVGETYQGVIFIRNRDEEPQEVKVYQTDYLFFFDGTNTYGEPGKAPRSNANWITFSPKRLTIPPKEASGVNYTIKVPDNETLEGTYWSMLMVEGISKNSPEFSKPEKEEVKLYIREVVRYGVQMVTHIGNTGTRSLKFVNTQFLKEAERKILQMDIENIGERWLNPFLWTELYDEKGSYIGRFEDKRQRIYPGTSVRYKVDLSQVVQGQYKALVVAEAGDDDVFGATYTLKIEEDKKPPEDTEKKISTASSENQ
ncbi:MAG: hypothetical protein AB1797_10795 [bacterium]